MPYDMRGMSSDSVQDAFRWSCNKNQDESVIQQQSCTVNNDVDMGHLTVASSEVSAVFTSQVDWALGAATRAMVVVNHLPQLVHWWMWKSVHEDSGHQGQYRSVSLAKQRFFLAKHGAQNTRSCATLSTLHCE